MGLGGKGLAVCEVFGAGLGCGPFGDFAGDFAGGCVAG